MIKRYKQPDIVIMLIVSFLILFGLIMIYSSSAIIAYDKYGDFAYFFKKQLLWLLIGIISMLAFMSVDYNRLKSFIVPAYLATLILLVLVLVVGKSVGGAQRWLRLGMFSFQPSELAKIITILMLAYFIDRRRSKITVFSKGVIPSMIILGIPAGLILFEPDLGMPFIIVCVGLILLFMGGAKIWHVMSIVLASIPFLLLMILAYPYRWKRMLTFLDPWSDPQGAGYQIIQSMLALGSGGFTGMGLGSSTTKLLYLPTPHTDFIFPVIGEELGFWGCLMLVGLFVFFSFRGFTIAKNAGNLFGSLVCAGLTFLISFQALINMGVSTGVLPTKGISLPFLSFGGSSLLFNMVAVGIILNISRQAKD